MKLRCLAVSLAVTVGLSAAGPASAGASPLARVLPPQLRSHVGAPVAPAPVFRSHFSVDAPDPYAVSVSTFGSAVILSVKRKGRGRDFAEAAYLARGVATPQRLQATFGHLGRVSMRFRRAPGGAGDPKRRCLGTTRMAVRRGTFVGGLRFAGEDGYLALRAHRAKGSIESVDGHCRRRRHFDGSFFDFSEEPPTGIVAIRRDGVDTTAFLAFSRHRRSSFFGLREETRGRLAIARIAFARRSSRLRVNEAATALRVRVPAPFHGAGVYRAAPDGSTTWTGGLAVNFPGAPRFPLAGSGFEALLEAPF